MEHGLIQKLTNYRVPVHAVALIRATRVVFIVGVTAAGKDTILTHLIAMPDYHHIVSHTTRPPRANHGITEQNGVDYHFVDLTTAETMLDDGGYIEAKKVHGNIYGTSVAEIQMAHDEGKIAITDIEVRGIAEYRAVADNVIPIFLLPPNFATWQTRLQKRSGGSLDPAELRVRLETAKDELQEVLDKDYFEFVINDDLETTIRVVDKIAHGNFSRQKNEQAKTVARQLLAELHKAL
ncbi:MAG: guanylate kinase [Candidatus Saccharimonadales bacterium]